MIRSLFTVAVLMGVFSLAGCKRPSNSQMSTFRPPAGSFELLILANETDDKEAIEAARNIFAKARTDPKMEQLLQRRAIRGEPPPPPVADPLSAFIVFNEDYTYRWALVSKQFVTDNLDPPSPAAKEAGRRRAEALLEARQRGEIYIDLASDGDRSRSMIWWSRERPGPDGLPEGIDYFLLVRQEPPERAISTDAVEFEWFGQKDKAGHYEIFAQLDEEAGSRFHRLTTMNRPDKAGTRSAAMRYMAILIGGKVIIAPTIKEPISGGRFVLTMGDDDLDGTMKLVQALQGK